MKAMNQLVIAGLFGAAAVLGGCATNTASATENEAPKANEDIMVQLNEGSQPRPFSSFCVDVDAVAKTVKVRLIGACSGCPSAGMTLQAGVEESIKKAVPEIKSVEAVM